MTSRMSRPLITRARPTAAIASSQPFSGIPRETTVSTKAASGMPRSARGTG